MRIALPYPPSMNHYWRHVGSRVLIGREGRDFREHVQACIVQQNARGLFGTTDSVAVLIDASVPDDRRRDLDNIQKPVLDALEHARVFEDDSQVDLLLTRRCERREPGRLIIQLEQLPLVVCPLCGRSI